MTISVLNRTFKGLAELRLRRATDGAILHLPVPNTFIVENNIEQRIQYSRSAQGVRVRSGTYVAGIEPVMRISYSFMQPETLQFKIGNEFEAKTSALKILKSYNVTQGVFPAAVSGQLGFNVVQDQPSQASITRNNVSFQLTQVPVGSFNPATPDTFAVDAGLEVSFSNNLVNAVETVSLYTQESFNGYGIGDNLVGNYSVVAQIITTENKVVIFSADFITVNLDGSGFDPSADQMEIPFYINNPPGSCFPYEMFFTDVTVPCA
jgi:hypothetical protein